MKRQFTTARSIPQYGAQYDARAMADTTRFLESVRDDLQFLLRTVNGLRQTSPDADASPSVSKCGRHGLLELANTGATSVTTLDDGDDLQVVTLKATTGNTTLVHSGTFRLAGSVNRVMTANDCVTMMLDATVWREIARTNA